MVFQRQLSQSEQVGRLCSSTLHDRLATSRLALPPQCADRPGDQQEQDDHGGRGDPAPALPPLGPDSHRPRERLFHRRQPTRIALPPGEIVEVGSSGPEIILRSAVLLPELRLVTQFVAQLGALGVLGAPADQAGPGVQEGLVNDLDACGSSFVVHFVGGQQAGVDQSIEDLRSGDTIPHRGRT